MLESGDKSMKKKSLLVLLLGLFLFLAACGAGENSNTETNAAANEVNKNTEEVADEEEASELTTSKQATDGRIISTTVALTEIMDKLELDLVGVPTSYKDLPERYKDAAEVGMAMEPDLEIILSLKPTDVLSATTLEKEFELDTSFSNADIPVTFVNMESVEGMYEGILNLGEKYDRTEQAEAIIDNFEEQLAITEEKVANKESPTVLILLGVPGSYLVATENSYIGDLVKRAGGTNAIQGEDVEYVSSNTENLQQSNPDVILRAAHGMPDEVVEMFDREFAENDIWKHFTAVENGRVYDLEETRFGTTANLAAVEALEELVDMLYPEDS